MAWSCSLCSSSHSLISIISPLNRLLRARAGHTGHTARGAACIHPAGCAGGAGGAAAPRWGPRVSQNWSISSIYKGKVLKNSILGSRAQFSGCAMAWGLSHAFSKLTVRVFAERGDLGRPDEPPLGHGFAFTREIVTFPTHGKGVHTGPTGWALWFPNAQGTPFDGPHAWLWLWRLLNISQLN